MNPIAKQILRRLFRAPDPYDGLFDASWYGRGRGGSASELLSYYRRTGWRSGASPNACFNPDDYLERYPDVRLADCDPLEHFAQLGWREGRDPGPAFSTSWYLQHYPDVASDDVNPLVHYLRYGRLEGRQPHPLLQAVDTAKPRVAIIIVSFNAPEVLALTLASLGSAGGVVPFKVFLIENGSEPPIKSLVRTAVDQCAFEIELLDSPENRGFSGGNNLGMQLALTQGFTHLCLLNSDVIVTSGWLDRLIETGQPVVGPVSNAVGNEQTVPIDYVASRNKEAISLAERFSKRWSRAWRRQVVATDFLGFFCVLLRRDVVEQVGLLDERFFPGSYEDDDYCLRLLSTGYSLAIARHVYIHHWGSASFGALPMAERRRVGDDNRQRFEQKHGRPWQDRTHLLVRSLLQDQSRLMPAPGLAEFQQSILVKHAQLGEATVARLAEAITHTQRQNANLAAANHKLTAALKSLDPSLVGASVEDATIVRFGVEPQKLQATSPATRKRFDELVRTFWRSLERARGVKLADLAGIQPILAKLALNLPLEPVVIVLAGHDPVTAPRADGYCQRIVAIDEIISPRPRLYVVFGEEHRGQPTLTFFENNMFRLDVADDDVIAEALLDALIEDDADIYVHSILRLKEKTAHRILRTRRRNAILDLHGAVPEEFRMCEDPFSAQLYGRIEKDASQRFGRFICVSQSMADFYRDKYQIDTDKLLICPIFPKPPPSSLRSKSYNARPRIIYAGGAARWQNVGKMLDLIADLHLTFDFTLLSADTAVFRDGLSKRGMTPTTSGVTLREATPPEVWAAYSVSDFGLVLRDDNTVNRVSCPTKLVEYICAGVIPIMQNPNLGDFGAQGLVYLDLEAVRDGRIPDQETRQAMARHNRDVFERMMALAERGKDQIASLLTNPRVAARAVA